MRYLIEEYNNDGFLKAPKLLLAGWLFLAKAWIIFIVAGASRDMGAKLLEIIYPVHSSLYLGLIAGFPALLLIWLLSLRKHDRKRICMVVSYGKLATLITISVQILLVLYQIYLENSQFSWPNAVTLLSLIWLMLYILRSRRVRDCFRSPLLS
ncbi:DUF2919 domain-containing protein [Vibrio algarum]|uniref:DUF2919 domain-containing protein n=1 Tax=Vibrio algarum TaxID=3020714 RepID=A0ABT4YSN3_9VIBR|nr:DUF2919 domain-containing protein [Vibrio sp. KJ40-1]MDB1124571.1 DUF2919 domain-containing protein [Vibrio sp. KJ40-1]